MAAKLLPCHREPWARRGTSSKPGTVGLCPERGEHCRAQAWSQFNWLCKTDLFESNSSPSPFSGTSLVRVPSSPLQKTKQLSATSPGPQHCWVCGVQQWPLPTFSHSPGGRQLQRYRSHTHLAAALSATALPHPMASGGLLSPSPGAAMPKVWEHHIRALLGPNKGWSWRQTQVLSNTLCHCSSTHPTR